jgi:hypothetical protein
VLPAASVAEHVTLVVPSGNVEPETGAQVAVKEPSTTSDAETVKVTTAPLGPVASTVMSPGTVTTGGVFCWTVTAKNPVAVFPALSVAEQVTLVVPSGNAEPEAGVQVTGTEPSTRSEAEAENVTIAPLAPVALTVMLAGTVTTGGVLS